MFEWIFFIQLPFATDCVNRFSHVLRMTHWTMNEWVENGASNFRSTSKTVLEWNFPNVRMQRDMSSLLRTFVFGSMPFTIWNDKINQLAITNWILCVKHINLLTRRYLFVNYHDNEFTGKSMIPIKASEVREMPKNGNSTAQKWGVCVCSLLDSFHCPLQKIYENDGNFSNKWFVCAAMWSLKCMHIAHLCQNPYEMMKFTYWIISPFLANARLLLVNDFLGLTSIWKLNYM